MRLFEFFAAIPPLSADESPFDRFLPCLIYILYCLKTLLRDLKEWLTGTRPRLAFTRRQVFAAVKPKHGHWAALHYYESLRRSFLTHDDSTCLLSSQPWVSRGHRDAAILRADPTQLQSILHRLSKAP